MITFLTVLFFASPLAVAYLIYRNYQLEKRWRCVRYCWQSMSDFAAERLRDADGIDEQWAQVVNEQIVLMAKFGAKTLTTNDIRQYELALLERGFPILTVHKFYG